MANNNEAATPSGITIKGILGLLMKSIDAHDKQRLISLGIGDPIVYSAFRTTRTAEDAVAETLRSQKFNGYAPTVGLPQARRAIAESLSRDLPYKLTSDDVFLMSGCTQAIDAALTILSRPNANVLIPRPGFPVYELIAYFRRVEVRYYDLVAEKGWEVNLETVEALADENTVAVVIINPGNPCGNMPLFDKILSGCTVKRLLQLAPKLVEEGLLKYLKTANLTVEEAKGAAEMMYTGSTLPLLPIISWDDQPIGKGKVGELTMALSDLIWEDMVAGPETQRIQVPYM